MLCQIFYRFKRKWVVQLKHQNIAKITTPSSCAENSFIVLIPERLALVDLPTLVADAHADGDEDEESDAEADADDDANDVGGMVLDARMTHGWVPYKN